MWYIFLYGQYDKKIRSGCSSRIKLTPTQRTYFPRSRLLTWCTDSAWLAHRQWVQYSDWVSEWVSEVVTEGITVCFYIFLHSCTLLHFFTLVCNCFAIFCPFSFSDGCFVLQNIYLQYIKKNDRYTIFFFIFQDACAQRRGAGLPPSVRLRCCDPTHGPGPFLRELCRVHVRTVLRLLAWGMLARARHGSPPGRHSFISQKCVL